MKDRNSITKNGAGEGSGSWISRPPFSARRIGAAVLLLLAPMRLFPAASPGPSNDIPALLPPRGEIPPTFWEQSGGGIAVLGVLLLVFTGAVVWFLRRPRPAVVLPPEVQARQALAALSRQTEDGVVLSRVSQVLRRYVAAAFQLPPGELTTAEFCRALDGREQIGPDLSAALAEFLRQCDERKFAPSAPPARLGAAPRALELVDLAEARRARAGQAAAGVSSPPARRA